MKLRTTTTTTIKNMLQKTTKNSIKFQITALRVALLHTGRRFNHSATKAATDELCDYSEAFKSQSPPIYRDTKSQSSIKRVRTAPKAVKDLYPSRKVPYPDVIQRQDPPVYRDAAGKFAKGPLSDQQLKVFEEKGHVMAKKLFSPEEADYLKEMALDLRKHYEGMTYDELDKGMDMKIVTERAGGISKNHSADKPTIKSIWELHKHDAEHMKFTAKAFSQYARDTRLLTIMQQIIGEEVYIHQSRLNYQPGVSQHNISGGGGFLWHQDFEQWHAEDGMPRMRCVSAAILLDYNHSCNGALMIVPSSHTEFLPGFSTGKSDYKSGGLSTGAQVRMDVLEEYCNKHGIAYCKGEPGDVVFFDCNLFHGSHTNLSPWSRMNLFCVYNAVSNTLDNSIGSGALRPEHLASRDKKWAGVPLKPYNSRHLASPQPLEEDWQKKLDLAWPTAVFRDTPE